ncbi:MAG: protein kinase [Planctomycetes bacterium]|nr:protein kinase [Planctomycetota bacterium]
MSSPKPSARDLFEQALQVGVGARADFLAAACAGDEALRAAVDQLLAADARSRGFLDEAALAAAAAASDPLLGRTVGNYRIVRHLGTGGMGMVFEAEQKEPSRSVALKVLRGSVAVPAMLARFHREAALLARLEHPGIASIYESGMVEVAGDAMPFLAMELVRGARGLLEHAADHRLDRAQRLRLFAQVCEAVAAAHAQGVVHRDLKPGNVLVSADGRPRVIDFGIARALDEATDDSLLATRTGQFVGTPRYMSPEQLRGGHRAVDARADVWALGLMLHELLAGGFPFALEGKSITEIAAIVAAQEPRRLGSVDPSLRGDLEVIVSHCLRKAPDERYADAGELQREIERHLAGEPIQARADHTLYVLRRRLRRHRAVLAALGTVLVAAIGSGIGFAVLWQQAVEARARSERSLYESQIALAADALRGFRTKDLKQTLAACADGQRRWEWRHLAARADDALWTVRPWPEASNVWGVIQAIRVAPEGDLCAAALADGTVGLLDAATGAERGRLGRHSRQVSDLAFLPGTPRRLATTSFDGTGKVFDLDAGTELCSLRQPGEIHCLAVATDGARLFTADNQGFVRAWDATTGIRLWEQRHHSGIVSALTANRAGTVLASGGHDRSVCLTDAATGALLRRIDKSVQQSTVGLPDVLAHATPVVGLAFHVGDRFLFSASDDGFAKMWDTQSGLLLFYEQTGHQLGRIAVSPDGGLLAMAGRDSVLLRQTFDGRTLEPLRGHDAFVTWVAFAPDGHGLLVADPWEIRCFDVRRRGGCAELGRATGDAYALTTSGDRSTLVAADERGGVRVFAAGDLTVTGAFAAHAARIRDVTADATGARLWTAADDRRVRGFHLPAGERFAEAECPTYPRLQWYPGHVAVGGTSRDLVLRSDVDLAEVKRVTTPHQRITGLTATRDGSRVLTGGPDGWIRVWDGRTLAPLDAWQAHENLVGQLRFSPDESLLVSCGAEGSVRVWTSVDGTMLAECTGLTNPPCHVAVLPDNSRILLCTMRGPPRILAADTGATLLELAGSHSPKALWRGAAALDGDRLVACEHEGGVHVWTTTPLTTR